MMTVSRLKAQRKQLECKLAEAQQNLIHCEEEFAKSDEFNVYVMLMEAKDVMNSLYWQLKSVIHYIDNIDFYKECERQEREERDAKSVYINISF